MSTLNRRFCSTAAASLSLVVTAIAQTPPAPSTTGPTVKEEPVQLSQFDVTADQDVGYRSTNSAEATRMNTPIEDIPMSVTIYNQKFINDILATATDQLMAYEPSVVKTSENDAFIARGSTSVGTNYLDGFPQATGFTSQPLANIDRVEVIKGPDAVLYGAGNYGATINRVTKKPMPTAFNTLREILGDYHSTRTEYDFNTGRVPFIGGQSLMYRADGVVQRGYSWFGQRIREDNVSPSVAWQPTRNDKLVLEFFHDWIDNQSSWETPVHAGNPEGIVTGDGVYHKYTRRENYNVAPDFRHVERDVGSIDYSHLFSEHLQLRMQAQYAERNQHDIETFAENAALTILKDTVLVARTWRQQDAIARNYNGRVEAVGHWKIKAVDERILAGGAVIDQYVSTHNQQAPSNYGGLTGTALTGNGRNTSGGSEYNYFPALTLAQFEANPNLAGYNTNLLMPLNLLDRGNEPAVPPITAGPTMYDNALSKGFTASQDYYANDQISFFDRFILVAGIRHSVDTNKSINYLSGTFPNEILRPVPAVTSQWAAADTHSYGAVYHLNPEKTMTVYANMNTSFTPTYTINPDGSLLQPQQAHQKELGLRFSFLHNRISGLVNYYDLLQDHVVTADPTRPGYFVQLDGQRTKGGELSLNTSITDNWLAFGGIAYAHAFANLTGVPQYLQPVLRGTLFNRYQFSSGKLNGLSLSLGAIYTGSRPIQTATVSRVEPNWAVPAEWRFDGIIGYKFKTQGRFRYDANFKVTNIFDNQHLYYVAMTYRYTIDPGRQWQAVFSAHF
jgi:outer membrane receptor protein involved in Fe transport